MSQAEFLKMIFAEFERLGIAAMLVGSHASSFYGEARSTHDIDIVIELSEEQIPGLIGAFPAPRYYLSEIALREGRMANLIDTENGDKADLFLLGKTAANRLEFDRRVKAKVMGTNVGLATAEDTIIAKLGWSHDIGGSEQQIRDVQQIVLAQKDRLDREYIRNQLASRDLMFLWDQVSEMFGKS